jgi:hypothetical protein
MVGHGSAINVHRSRDAAHDMGIGSGGGRPWLGLRQDVLLLITQVDPPLAGAMAGHEIGFEEPPQACRPISGLIS